MLLIDDCQPKVAERDFFLEQRMRPDQHVNVPEREALQNLGPFPPTLAAGQYCKLDADCSCEATAGGEKGD